MKEILEELDDRLLDMLDMAEGLEEPNKTHYRAIIRRMCECLDELEERYHA